MDKKLDELITEYGNASFDCGEHDDVDGYDILISVSHESREALMAHIKSNYTKMQIEIGRLSTHLSDMGAYVMGCCGFCNFLERADCYDRITELQRQADQNKTHLQNVRRMLERGLEESSLYLCLTIEDNLAVSSISDYFQKALDELQQAGVEKDVCDK